MAETSDAAFNIEEAGYSFNHIEFNINDRSLMNYPVSAYAYHYEDKFEGKLSISGIKTRERVEDNVIKVSILPTTKTTTGYCYFTTRLTTLRQDYTLSA